MNTIDSETNLHIILQTVINNLTNSGKYANLTKIASDTGSASCLLVISTRFKEILTVHFTQSVCLFVCLI